MIPLYLFCLVVGGGLLLFSLLATDADGAGHGDSPAGLHPPGDGLMAHEFFSIRAFFYLLAGFGATGFLLDAFTAASGGAALFWATLSGLLAATLAAVVYGWLRRTESGLVPLGDEHLVGVTGRVIVPVAGDRRGKIVALTGGREVELLARLYSPADPACGRDSTVVIVEIDGDTALVTPLSFLPSGPR